MSDTLQVGVCVCVCVCYWNNNFALDPESHFPVADLVAVRFFCPNSTVCVQYNMLITTDIPFPVSLLSYNFTIVFSSLLP